MASRIVHAYDTGQPLPDGELGTLVEALRVFTADGTTDAHLQQFGKIAGFRAKKGRHGATAAEAAPRINAAAAVLIRERELTAAGITSSDARATATREVAVTHRRSLRSVQADMQDYAEAARQTVEILDYAQRLHKEQSAMLAPQRVLVERATQLAEPARGSRKRIRADKS